MASAIVSEPVTTEALLEIPDNGMERWLVRGELKEKPMTVRNRVHSKVMALLTGEIDVLARLPARTARRRPVRGGRRAIGADSDTTVGVDIVYVSADTLARQSDKTTLIEGVPQLMVEILSPSDTLDEINEKIDTYLSAGVPLVWIVDPRRRTVAIYRPQGPASLVAEGQELHGEQVLPGFRASLDELFR